MQQGGEIMKKIYLITGASGHVGSALCARLREKGERIRALVLRGDDTGFLRRLGVEIVFGDVRSKEELREFFTVPEGYTPVVIHCAAIVDIGGGKNPALEEVNVGGTRNVMEECMRIGAEKVVYVSSVHALSDLPKGRVKREQREYVPDKVDGAYAKSKARAANEVLAMAKKGLPVVIVQPSGIIGPYNGKANHLVQMIKNYLTGKLPASVKGGYDFVDVRDVADGILAAEERGRVGESYLLTGNYHPIPQMISMLRSIAGGRKIGTVPFWLAKIFAPLSEYLAKKRGRKPLFTSYSLRVLRENARFSHDKATSELGYRPRELYKTLQDTAEWLRETGELPPEKKSRRRAAGRVRVKA